MTAGATDVVVVGAGLAGAATAFFLSRARGLRVVLLEQEAAAGVHSSGRNAGLVRRASGEPELDALCDEGAAFLAAPPDDFPAATGFRRTGSFLLVTPVQAQAWRRDRMELVTPAELARAVPPFRPGPGSAPLAILHTEDDGVVDARALLDGFLAGARARGVDVRIGEAVRSLRLDGDRVAGVVTTQGTIAGGCVVDAAGAWASLLVVGAPAAAPPLVPHRRHLLLTAPDARVDAGWPWVWDTLRGFYFRPEAGGLLACACDDAPDRAGDCASDPAMAAAILAKVAQCLPALSGPDGLRPRRLWAGHRTRSAAGGFVLGADRRLAGLVWAAGLGGHGVTTAAAVGRRAAEAALLRCGRG